MPSFWNLRGPSRFVSIIAEDLDNSKNVILCLPPSVPEGLLEHIAHKISQLPRTIIRFTAQQLTGDKPLAAICTALLPETPPVQVPLELARHAELPEQVVLIDGLGMDGWEKWREFLTEYAHACRSLAPKARPRILLCVVASGTMALTKHLPHEDTSLAHHYYYGVVSRSDMLLYAAQICADMKGSDLQRQLAVATLFHVSQWDPGLCNLLAREPWSRIMNPRSILKVVARQHGWAAPGELPTWFNGGVNLFGTEERVHSAYYHGGGDPDREIERRLLCAQMAVLLPLVEERRPALLQVHEPVLGNSYTAADGRQIRRIDMEIGHIAHALNRRGHASSEVEILAHIRRNLAHITKLDLLEIERLEGILANPSHAIGRVRPREPLTPR